MIPEELEIYDITGRLIRSLSDLQGSSFLWDGRDGAGTEVPTGTYLIQGAIDGQVSSLRVVRL
jgi:flagellar hook assembly protein FlgD